MKPFNIYIALVLMLMTSCSNITNRKALISWHGRDYGSFLAVIDNNVYEFSGGNFNPINSNSPGKIISIDWNGRDYRSFIASVDGKPYQFQNDQWTPIQTKAPGDITSITWHGRDYGSFLAVIDNSVYEFYGGNWIKSPVVLSKSNESTQKSNI